MTHPSLDLYAIRRTCRDPESAQSMYLVQGCDGGLATGFFPAFRCRHDRRSGGVCEGTVRFVPFEAAHRAMESQPGGARPAEKRTGLDRYLPTALRPWRPETVRCTRWRKVALDLTVTLARGGRLPGRRGRGSATAEAWDRLSATSVRTTVSASAGRTTVGLNQGSPGRRRGGVGDGAAGASGYRERQCS